MPEPNAPYYGWYSEEATQYGTVIYRRPDGTEVEITSASQDPIYTGGWEDAVFLGLIGEWVRPGRQGKWQETTERRLFKDRIGGTDFAALITKICDEQPGLFVAATEEVVPDLIVGPK